MKDVTAAAVIERVEVILAKQPTRAKTEKWGNSKVSP
jgi:hypothetical protein